MEFLRDPDFWVRWLQVVGIDLLLAGDNALVIALAVRTLPKRHQLLGRLWGTAGAVALRLVFIALISLLLQISFLYFIGGAVLVWIAIKLILQGSGDHGGAGREGSNLWEAIWIIIVADVSMSIDNVLAISGAAGGDMVLVSFGVALSIPLVVWGSGLLASLMNRFPWIIWLGGGLLGEIAGHMMLHDSVVHAWLGERADLLEYPVRIALFVAVAALGWWRARTARIAREGATPAHG